MKATDRHPPLGVHDGRQGRLASTDGDQPDRGYVMALSALLMVPLMAFVGFAVDLGAWYARAAQVQGAAEAASLAGVVHMPDFDRAEQVALEVAASNGFIDPNPGVPGDGIDIEVSPAGDGLNSLQVTIDDTNVDQYFTSLFTDTVTIERGAVSEYVSSIRMGSACNFLGNDPVSAASGSATEPDCPPDPDHWLVTFGQRSPKHQGDRYHTIDCGEALVGCDGNRENTEYQESGYYFTVGVTPPSPGALPSTPLKFQVFDPFFYDFDNRCPSAGAPEWRRFLPTLSDVQDASGWYQTTGSGLLPGVDDLAFQGRYASGRTQWCTGDSDGSNGTGTPPEPETTFIVRAPSGDPFDPTSGDIICAVKYGAINVAGQDGYKDQLVSSDTDETSADVLIGNGSSDETLTFERGFRRWLDLCEVSSGSVQEGEYIIQVRTNVTSNPDLAENDESKGNNRYSLRAGWSAGTTDGLSSDEVDRVASNGTTVAVGAIGRLPVFVNTGGSATKTEFFMARVTPEYRGKRLVLDIYDTTDGGAIDRLELVPGSDATYTSDDGTEDAALTEWPDCTFYRVSDEDGHLEFGTGGLGGLARTSETCAMRGIGGAGNKYAIRIEIDIPTTYDCNESDPFGCWVKMEIDYGEPPQDTTTWSANIDGDPVRLTG